MAKRGRKSAAGLALPGPIEKMARLAPVEGLSAAERELWLDVVNAMPANWFAPEQAEVLAIYVRHAVSAANLSMLVNRISPAKLGEDGALDLLNNLLKMRERESRGAIAAARALRLTNQSRYHPTSAAREIERGKSSAAARRLTEGF
jgi:hypothetical protein